MHVGTLWNTLGIVSLPSRCPDVQKCDDQNDRPPW